jgi:hypothetical protein
LAYIATKFQLPEIMHLPENGRIDVLKYMYKLGLKAVLACFLSPILKAEAKEFQLYWALTLIMIYSCFVPLSLSGNNILLPSGTFLIMF